MATGTVKWFSSEKGYGFITPDDGTADVFVHHSGIAGEGYKNLDEGQKVEYEVTQGQKGPQAVGVKRTSYTAVMSSDLADTTRTDMMRSVSTGGRNHSMPGNGIDAWGSVKHSETVSMSLLRSAAQYVSSAAPGERKRAS